MVWKKLKKAATGSPSGSSISSATKPLNRLSLEKPRIESNVLIKLHYKETTYRIRFNLSEGTHKLRRLIMAKLDFPENESFLVYGYVDLDYNLTRISDMEDLMGCKKYFESHCNADYVRLVIFDSWDSKTTIIRQYKDMETIRKEDLAVAERKRITPQPAYCPPQCGKEGFNEHQSSFQLVTITDGVLSTHKINYEFKDGYYGLRKAVEKEFKDLHCFLAYFDRNSSLTVIQDTVHFNESYNWIFDNRNIVLYYFPMEHARKAYKHHYQEVSKRWTEPEKSAVNGKSDSSSPPEYHTLSETSIYPKVEQGMRHFKIGWTSDNVFIYDFFKYNPTNGILSFKDILEEHLHQTIEQPLGYFDEDMDSITIDTDEDLVECTRAIRGPIIIFAVNNWQAIRKLYSKWSEELIKLQRGEAINWND